LLVRRSFFFFVVIVVGGGLSSRLGGRLGWSSQDGAIYEMDLTGGRRGCGRCEESGDGLD